ncbi:MAG: helix-turn-helix domain-containing protein [Saprospiraceae bacterium]|nr:helix-turn-helix domain-containing protein [Saprospiraceae bacterium]HNL39469.1 helix-turn-helix domain-containing protein [Saprospiraceae bacterium]
MANKIPTYSICNLLGADRCMNEVVVMRIHEFLRQHKDLTFPHRHDFYQIVLFTKGSGRHAIDFQTFEVKPHQIYYMAPGQVHTWQFNEDVEGYIINFNESFFTAFCHNPFFLREFPLFNTVSGSPVNILDMSCCTEVEQTLATMLEEFGRDGEFKMDLLRGMLITVLVRLSRAAPSTFREHTSKHNVALMRQFEKMIELHFREKRLPKEYAEMLFVTPNHLNALTKDALGKSAGELIRDRVLLEAKRLLVNSDLMISQIADTLNFEDNAYFTRFFKKYTGATPEQFRATQAAG